jgi:hypothetical protein
MVLGAFIGNKKLIELPSLGRGAKYGIGGAMLAASIAIAIIKTPALNQFRGSFSGDNEVVSMLLCIASALPFLCGIGILFQQLEQDGLRLNEAAWLGTHSFTYYLFHMFYAWLLSIIFGVMLLVLGILAPVILVMNAADKSLREKNEYQETYLNAELEYIERYKNAQTETRAFRHDIINNLSLTSMMLDEGNVEDASQHLKELLGNVRALSPSIITGDEMLDCIVAMKADKMKELDIRFTTDGVVDGGLHMKPMDVCSIFANALDNAIEAARKVEKEPWIDLKIKRTEKFFVLKISNAAEGKVNVEKLFMSNGYTSKNDKEHHGFGLRNIRQAVEEYDGLVKAEAEEGTFGLSIMIPRK